ncbi:hypothetical protein QR680_014771 [Steinernema hermaphroditum]|uniref:DUF3456 domain-containing protein n=1 Tax=Steinernema hermaphroditum TaxID=289476 RepID=A0AA39IA26_9BILA|nr:hypothetical protein QR680_014771 [Steinernema hermaphroditum]
MLIRIALLSISACFFGVQAAVANAKCGACVMLVNELEAGVQSVDPKKMIQVGSFRVDGKGNQKGLNEIPYARSETHLVELLDNICDKSKDYVSAAHPTTGKTVFVKKQTADHLHLKSDASQSSKLANACHDFIDDHEDGLVKFLKVEHENPVRGFCHQETSSCTSVDVTPFPEESPEPEDSEEDDENDEL